MLQLGKPPLFANVGDQPFNSFRLLKVCDKGSKGREGLGFLVVQLLKLLRFKGDIALLNG
jgi:hypothetical protein